MNNILIGISGGIAIYKILELISLLKKADFGVDIIMTESACEFISPMTFETMSRARVYTDSFNRENPSNVTHIDLAERADIFLVAPATANIMAKMANGIADDLLTTTALAIDKKTLIAPAMNTKMLNHPATRANMKVLEDRGVQFISTEEGFLACNVIGDGRMASAPVLLESILDGLTEKDLCGKKILITGGGTSESIDPVRMITNRSSGKTSWQLALMAARRGAEVTLITTKNMPNHYGIKKILVQTTQNMLDAVEREFDNTDVLIMAAAPADFRPSEYSDEKIKKSEDEMIIKLERNPDILKTVTKKKKKQFVIAFAAETENVIENAAKKRIDKNADLIIANDVKQDGAGFGVDTNIVTLINKSGERKLPKMSKADIANKILDELVSIK